MTISLFAKIRSVVEDLLFLFQKVYIMHHKNIVSAMTLYFIRDKLQLQRFAFISKQYFDICKELDTQGSQSKHHVSGSEGYDWKHHTEEIRNSFEKGVHLGFLRQHNIAVTMVNGGDYIAYRKKIKFIQSVFKNPAELLREDYIGLPHIVGIRYVTSENRTHHAYHLASYEVAVKKSISQWSNVVEWGGGYGDMARLVKRLNNGCTYIIIDITELCVLQYVYLYSLLGEEVNLVIPDRTGLIKGKINIVSVGSVLSGEIKIFTDAFISTWALTESPRESQMFVYEKSFFGAENILLAYSPDGHNHLKSLLPAKGFIVKPISVLENKHDYAFR